MKNGNDENMNFKMSIIGAGAWGTTLSSMIAQKSIKTTIWAYKKETADDINKLRENREFLPGIAVATQVYATHDLREAAEGAKYIIVASPSHTLRNIIKKIIPFMEDGTSIISVTKGIEENTFATVSEIISEELSEKFQEMDIRSKIAVVSGPNLAREIAAGLPSSTVVASASKKLRESMQEILSSNRFRVYTSDDIVGVELGGSLKNIMAIGAGICDGLKYGDNTKAAFLTRALREMIRIGDFKGARQDSFYGLSGIGDLFATSYSKYSRNRTLGEKIAVGNEPGVAEKLITGIAEGVHTAKAAHLFGKKENLDLPVINEIYKILYEKKDPSESVMALMSRTLKGEIE
ncbi:MAG TPA: NAD(P)H-dependent glycerol-3-phosphate dehydrogenase [Candidatus Wallbacteria bacterium]|nr:NAD(P)H-dependent glycerol-3-phosphate dehydrogenase [Candidatus Wallbacteria bacterium]